MKEDEGMNGAGIGEDKSGKLPKVEDRSHVPQQYQIGNAPEVPAPIAFAFAKPRKVKLLPAAVKKMVQSKR